MTKPKQKKRTRDSDEDTIDRLNNEIRELKSLNRSLLRRLKKLDRNFEEALEEEEEAPKHADYKPSVKLCPNCKTGELSEVVIESLGKKYTKCNGPGCRYRTSTEKM